MLSFVRIPVPLNLNQSMEDETTDAMLVDMANAQFCADSSSLESATKAGTA